MKKLKIVIFTDVFLPSVNGVVTSCLALIEEWLAQGHEVCVVAPKYKKPFVNKNPKLKIIFLPSLPSVVYPDMRLGFLSKKLVFELKKFNPDLVHITAPGTVGVMGIVYAKLRKIKSVIVFHTYFMEKEYLKTIGLGKTSFLATPFLWQMTKFIYDEADLILTPSNFVKSDLLKKKFKNVIKVIKNGVKFKKIAYDKNKEAKFLDKYHLEKKKYFLYVGRISKEKNLTELIEIFKDFFLKNKDHKLLIVGYGPHLSELKFLVKKYRLGRKIVFSGKINNSDLFSFGVYKNARAFVTCSHSEVQPMAIIEALWAHCPILAYGSRGVGEMVGEAGVVLEPNNRLEFVDSLLNFVENKKKYLGFVKATKVQASNHNAKKIAEKHLEVYWDLINNKQ
jgi:1,2-diacylglycerol 3-alpha-glucosyltransferase